MKARILSISALALVAIAPAFGSAKLMEGDTSPIGVSFRLGGFFPIDHTARDAANTWFTGGLDYKLQDLGKSMIEGRTAYLSLSLDYTAKSDWSIVPVLVNYVARSGSSYYFAGAGAAFTRFPDGVGGTENKARFSYQIGAGFDLTTGRYPVFAEVKYVGSDQARFAGISTTLGVRF